MRGYDVVALLATVGMVATGCERWFTAPRGEEEPAIRTDRQTYMVGAGQPDFRYGFDIVAVFHNRLRQTVYLDVCGPGGFNGYVVRVAGNDTAATIYGRPHLDVVTSRCAVAPGEIRTDTLHLEGPFAVSIDGTPVGRVDGRMYLSYPLSLCTDALSTEQRCAAPAAVSNQFDVILPR